jgi:hypothetical protein
VVGRDSPGDGDVGDNQQHFAASAELLAQEETVNGNTKTRRPVMYQDVDEALVQWVEAYQANINISREMIRQKAAQFLERLHLDAPKFEFSSGWLAKFKQRH